jgi:hypothetical protein
MTIEGQEPYATFSDLRVMYHWVLETQRYTETALLCTALKETLLPLAEHKAQEMLAIRTGLKP